MSGIERLQKLQQQLEDAQLGHLELASAGNFVTIAGVVRNQTERDTALRLAKDAEYVVYDSIDIDDPANTDDLAATLREARQARDPVPILQRAIAGADERKSNDWRIELRLELEAKLRGSLRHPEAVAACREAVAIEANAKTLFALAACLHEEAVTAKEPDLAEIERLYERVIAMTDDNQKGKAQRMLEALRRTRDLRAKTT